MTYLPLARKYRPETFEDLMGQDDLKRALTNAIRLQREPSAMIFTGTRGVGKTTSARLFAKALNCDQGPSPSPCGTCYSCKAIAGGYHEDVLEIDGASHNGVSEVRALQETLSYTPQRSRYKVYIVDEVHMLSTSAFNALLKTLEEPPAQVIFIFATTEIQKVPSTILSRCQTFYLKHIAAKDIQNRLQEILQAEGVACEQDALSVIAREGNGSLRDALTFLDQVIAIGGGTVSLQSVEGLTSRLSPRSCFALLNALLKGSATEVLRLISQWDLFHDDYGVLSEHLAASVRHALVWQQLKHLDGLALIEEERQEIAKLADSFSAPRLHSLFKILSQIPHQLSGGLDRYIFENNVLEWCLESQRPLVDTQHKPSIQEELRESPPSFQERPPVPVMRSSAPVQPQRNSDATPPPSISVKGFPPTWEKLIEAMKMLRPIQGRKLEEAHVLTYSPQEILLAVDPTSFVGTELLRPDVQARWQKEFQQQFEFLGRLQILETGRVPVQQTPLQETVSEKKARDRDQESARRMTQAEQHPLTQALIRDFGAEVKRVELL